MSKGRLRRRSANSWQLRFDAGRDVTGKRKLVFKTVKGTKREAQAELTRALAAFEDGNWVEPSLLTTADYLQRWLTDHAAVTVSAKTFERYSELVNNHLAPRLGTHKLQKLTPLHIQAAYSEMLTKGRLKGGGGLSPRTVNHTHKLLFSAMRQAVRWQLVTRNVAEAVTPPTPVGREIAVLDDTQIGTLLKAARGTRLYVPILIAATTGLRRGEFLALRWPDLDLARGRLSVNQALEQTRAGIGFKAPKTKRSRRTVSLPSVAVEALKAHKAKQAGERLALGLGKDERALVFTNELGEPVNPRAASKEFARIVKRAGIPRVSLHSMRHSHITALLRANVHPKIASERAGHASISVTMDTYSHALPEMENDLVLGVDAAIRAALKD